MRMVSSRDERMSAAAWACGEWWRLRTGASGGRSECRGVARASSEEDASPSASAASMKVSAARSSDRLEEVIEGSDSGWDLRKAASRFTLRGLRRIGVV